MVEYFCAHHRPGHRLAGGAAVGAGFLAFYSWPVALALLPFLAYALLSPVSGRRRIAATAPGAGEMSAHTADTIQGLADLTAFQATGRRRDEFLQAADRYRERRLSMQRDLSRQNANLGTGRRPGRAGRGRHRRSRRRRHRCRHAAAAGADRAGHLPAGIGDLAGQPPAGRHHRRHAPAARGQPRTGAGERWAGGRAGLDAGPVAGLRARQLRLSRQARQHAQGPEFHRARRRHGGRGRSGAGKSTVASLLLRLGSGNRARSGWTAPTCAA